jgi:hypothetical protein
VSTPLTLDQIIGITFFDRQIEPLFGSLRSRSPRSGIEFASNDDGLKMIASMWSIV